MRKNIAAWTGPTPEQNYAEFVSINTEPHSTERRVTITVRNAAGEVVEVSMLRTEFAKLVYDAQNFVLENS